MAGSEVESTARIRFLATMRLRYLDGNVVLDTDETSSHAPVGSAVWGDVLTPHTLENVGEHELRDITVEPKHLT